jgi:hypothetical protein
VSHVEEPDASPSLPNELLLTVAECFKPGDPTLIKLMKGSRDMYFIGLPRFFDTIFIRKMVPAKMNT